MERSTGWLRFRAWFIAIAVTGTVLLAIPALKSRAQDADKKDAAPAAAAPATPPTAAPPEAAAAAPAAAPEVKPDSTGANAGGIDNVPVADAKAGLTIKDVADKVGKNVISINIVWTLITGFLVMFMQAGFALVETGLCRAKNSAHTMAMNFMIYPLGMLGFYVCGFAFMFGGCRTDRESWQ